MVFWGQVINAGSGEKVPETGCKGTKSDRTPSTTAAFLNNSNAQYSGLPGI